MKINGIMLVSPLMYQMEVGKTGYLSIDGIIPTGDEVFFHTMSSVSSKKNAEHIIPIKRIGTGKDEFEIDLNVAFYFYNRNLNSKKKQNLKKDPYIIGPFPIATEMFLQDNYRKQTYPRMDID